MTFDVRCPRLNIIHINGKTGNNTVDGRGDFVSLVRDTFDSITLKAQVNNKVKHSLAEF